jgi:hypothetical protein
MALQRDDVATYFVVISVVALTLLIEDMSCVRRVLVSDTCDYVYGWFQFWRVQ